MICLIFQKFPSNIAAIFMPKIFYLLFSISFNPNYYKYLLLLYISFYEGILRCARDDNSDLLRRHQLYIITKALKGGKEFNFWTII